MQLIELLKQNPIKLLIQQRQVEIIERDYQFFNKLTFARCKLFLTLYHFFYNKMDQEDYDDVRLKKTSYDKKLAILKEKIKNYEVFKKRKPRKSTSNASFSPFETIALSDQRLTNIDDSGVTINTNVSFKRQNFVRLFIEKMKLNSFNSIHNNRINLDRMKTLTSRIDNVNISSEFKGPKGWKAPDIIKLLIALVTLLTIVAIQFLATFQFLFQDYRQKFSSQIQVMILKQVLLSISIIRILSKMLFIKTILGEKIQHIYQIFYHYITSIEFSIDLIMLISIILMIIYPSSVFAGVFGCWGLIINIFYFQKTNKQMLKLVINNNIKKQIFALFRLLLANLFISHIVGIIIISISFIDPQINWMSKYGIENEQWFSKYIYGLYYSTTIITTVGFGDFTVSNRAQAICITFIVLFGCILLSYNITKVSSIIESLNQVPEKTRSQLLVLDRLAAATQIDQNLHHTIGQYIIHVGEIRRNFEVTERYQLIQTLPSQLKQQFIQQSSRNFCSKLPFFYMLQMQTKKRICQLLKMEVMSPNQYLTHKKLGLKKIIILRKGIVGLAYRKKGSSLNGRIVDTIQINSETEPPQLLNTYLLVRGRRLLYDIVCQKYCIVSLLQFDQFIESLKESETDYQLYHQTYDQANFRTSEWYRNKCTFCNFKHSIFVCPKMHYVPLRSMVFMKHQKNLGYNHYQKRYKYQRQKIWYSKCSPLKFWRKLFVPFQKVFDTHIQKSQILRLSKQKPKQEKQKDTSKWAQFEYFVLTKQFFDTVSVNVDMIQNYKYYFHKDNANNLIQKSVTQNKSKSRVQIQRFDKVELSQYAFYRS